MCGYQSNHLINQISAGLYQPLSKTAFFALSLYHFIENALYQHLSAFIKNGLYQGFFPLSFYLKQPLSWVFALSLYQIVLYWPLLKIAFIEDFFI